MLRKRLGWSIMVSVMLLMIAGLSTFSRSSSVVGATGTITISGKVTDPGNNAVVNATVSATSTSDSTIVFGPVNTGSDGSYALNVAAGVYNLQFTPPNGTGLSQVVNNNIMVMSDQVINAQLPLAHHTLYGRLTNNNGTPIPNADVALFSATAEAGDSATDSNGFFAVSVTPGKYYLKLMNLGQFLPGTGTVSQFQLSQTFAGTPPIDLTGSDITQNLQLPTVTLHLIVEDSKGNRVSGASISGQTSGGGTILYPGDPGEPITSSGNWLDAGTTDANGQLDFTAAAGIKYASNPNATGYLNICASISGGSTCLTGPYTVTGDATIVIQQPLTHTFSGTLTSSSGTPIQNAVVSLNSSNAEVAEVNTDSTGHYSLSVSPGSYFLGVRNGGQFIPGTGSVSQFRLAQSTTGTPPIDLTNADYTQNLQLQTATLHLAIKDGSGNPVAGASISGQVSGGKSYLYPNDVGEPITSGSDFVTAGTSDTNGNFNFTSVVGLRYASNPNAVSFQNICASISGSNTCLTSPYTVSGDDSIVIQQAVTHSLSGTLTNGAGAPISNADVALFSTTAEIGHIATDSNGHYSVSVVPGQYFLKLMNLGQFIPGTGNVSQFQLSQTFSGTPPIDLSNGDVTQNLRLQTVTLHVTVEDADGNPVAGTSVSGQASGGRTMLYGNDPGEPITSGSNFVTAGTTDSSGKLDFVSVTGIEYASNPNGLSFLNICATISGANTCLVSPYTVTNEANIVIRPAIVKPNVPTNLSAVSPTNHSPVLTWNETSSTVPVTSYNVYRDNVLVGNSTSTSFTDESVQTDGTYSYYVVAVKSSSVYSDPSNTVRVVYDTTVPTITYTPSPSANAGWNNTNVLITFECTDSLSGIQSCPNSTIFNSEGANQTLTGVAYDNAGNTTSVTTGPINIDETPPSLGTASWNNNPITTGQSATLTVPVSDSLSGITGGEYYIGSTDPGQGNGTALTLSNGNLTATLGSSLAAGTYTISYRAEDVAGNWDMPQTTTLTVAPVAPANLTAPSPTKNSPALSWTAVDGVDSYNVYRNGSLVDSTTQAHYADSSITTDDTYQYYVTAVGGGVESAASNSVTVVYDTTKPTINYIVSPVANNDWNNNSVTVTFTCADNLSSVASCTDPITLTGEGANQKVTGTATDSAGNTASVTAIVNIDKTNPTITYIASPLPNGNTWNNSSVLVTFNCSDALSGIDTCTNPIILSSEGANQTVTGTAVDKAGNATSVTTSPINIDETAPTLGDATLAPNPITTDQTSTLTVPISDGLSGVAGGEYYIGDTDPGLGHGTAMTLAGTNLSASFGPNLAAGTYKINYRGLDIADNWDLAKSVTLTIKPITPTNLSAASPTNSAPALSWTAVTGAASYNVYRDGVLAGSPITNSYTDVHAAEGSHSYYVTAVGGGVESDHSNTISVLLDESAPTINYTLSPAPNTNHYNNSNVTVTFNCADESSGVASCTSPVTLTDDGANQTVTGIAVDNAGNVTTTSASVNLDKTAPTINYTLSPAPNTNQYNKGDVTVTFSCSDALSGVATCSDPVTLSTEGAGQTVTGTAVDKAGNSTSVTATVNIDKTAPTISYVVAPTANANGWNNGSVTVTFTCSDALSGIQTCPQPVVLSSEGANQSASGTAVDKAGNTKTVTASGINIDKTSPTISYSVSPTPNAGGWNRVDVTVTFTCADTLSGIQSCPAPVTVSTEGANQAVTGTAVDKAGNTASTTATINLDKAAPTIGYTLSPAANSNGWNNSNVTVTFNCSDALSGIASCSAPVTLSTEGANQTVTGIAVDVAGNTSSVTATVNIDKTAPTISYTVAPTANSNGWDNANVTVSFTCSDTLSGIQTCPSPVTLSTDGANQSVSGTAVDKAGNTKSVTATGINIDKTAPTITYSVSPAPNIAGWNNSNVTVAFTCSDSLSGVQSCPSPVTLSTEGANQTVSGTVTDKAGNSTSVSTNAINIDKTGPAISAPTMSSTTIIPLLTGTITFGATTSDSLSGVLTGEYYVDTDPGQGNGTAMTYSSGKINGSSTFSGLSAGQHTLFMRSKDKAGNWSVVVSVTFTFI